LMSFGVKILVLGDPAQLPPVAGCGFFINAKPNAMLTEIHRQARDNPIIVMSMKVRAGERLTFGNYGSSRVTQLSDLENEEVVSAEQVLVGTNRTRLCGNQFFRELFERSSPYPEKGDRLICLRNRHDRGLLNGSLWRVEETPSSTADEIEMRIKPEDGSTT